MRIWKSSNKSPEGSGRADAGGRPGDEIEPPPDKRHHGPYIQQAEHSFDGEATEGACIAHVACLHFVPMFDSEMPVKK